MDDDPVGGCDFFGRGASQRARQATCQRGAGAQALERRSDSIAHGKIIACRRYGIIGSSSRPGILGAMRTPMLSAFFSLCGLGAGCASPSATKPVELLDERTGMTVAALEEPIELVPGVQTPAIVSR